MENDISKSLINLTMSKDPANHELFHHYYDLDAKLEALNYFWDVTCHELPHEYTQYIFYWFTTTMPFQYAISFRTEGYKVSFFMHNFLNGNNFYQEFEELSIEPLKTFFRNLVIENHAANHK